MIGLGNEWDTQWKQSFDGMCHEQVDKPSISFIDPSRAFIKLNLLVRASAPRCSRSKASAQQCGNTKTL